MKILHITPSLNPEWGGVPKVVTDMTEALVTKGIEVLILTAAEKGKEKEVFRPKGVNVRIFKTGFFSYFLTSYSPGIAPAMKTEIENCDLVHIHGLWHYLHYLAYEAAIKLKKPYGITVHDQLSGWDLKHKTIRKKLYSLLVQRRILREASFVHTIIDTEAEDVRNYGIESNIYVIPNGIGLEDWKKPTISRFNLHKLRNKMVVLFLGRIHPKKGLDLLAKAWVQITRNRDDLMLIIAGPDTQGYIARIKDILKSGNVMNKVIFLGMVQGDKKKAILERADIVVIPSYSEVRSLVALEAMISQKPVIITNKCHFPEIYEVAAGIVIEPNVEQLVNALNRLIVNPELRRKMGQNGKKLVLESNTWENIVNKIIEMYKYAIKK